MEEEEEKDKKTGTWNGKKRRGLRNYIRKREKEKIRERKRDSHNKKQLNARSVLLPPFHNTWAGEGVRERGRARASERSMRHRDLEATIRGSTRGLALPCLALPCLALPCLALPGLA